MAEHQPYYYGTGRRKTAVARVRLFPNGDGTMTINGRNADQYFGREVLSAMAHSPLRQVEMAGRFNIRVKVAGGGVSGQAGAVRHGLARALVRADEEFRPALRRAGFLTRDPRMKERKKPGLKRARKAPQYTKR
ncbi:MAG: SSU ribosomal protein S9p (S16e) [Ktedonobacterales bacterium]|nr:MAG: SSU ribosomal protein S9p (S16e) [Ktedonobacterales bacterium]